LRDRCAPASVPPQTVTIRVNTSKTRSNAERRRPILADLNLDADAFASALLGA
jgi:hypothetical protein